MRQSVGSDNYDQITKDIAQLSLEKYVDELAGAVLEGIGKCKTERDVWSAVEVRIFCIKFCSILNVQFIPYCFSGYLSSASSFSEHVYPLSNIATLLVTCAAATCSNGLTLK